MADRPYVEFLRRSEAAVSAEMPDVTSKIEQGGLGAGSWHPTGFATFTLSLIPGLGLMRLHVWPARLRFALPRHPQIHQHSFMLYSRVLAGEYVETQYRVTDLRSGVGEPGPRALYRFVVKPTELNEPDVIEETGVCVGVEAAKHLRFLAGSWHDVECGTFHATPIPVGRLCATVALLSTRVPGAEDVLLGRPGFTVPPEGRRAVTADEQVQICSQLVEALRGSTYGLGR